MGVIVSIQYNHLGEFTAEMERRAALAVEKAARDIEAQAKDRVPVDTGNLKGSIQAQPEPEPLTWTSGSRGVEYAPWVEYGTGQRGDPAVPHRPDWPGMAPRPYMRPAAERVRPAFIQAMKQIAKR